MQVSGIEINMWGQLQVLGMKCKRWISGSAMLF